MGVDEILAKLDTGATAVKQKKSLRVSHSIVLIVGGGQQVRQPPLCGSQGIPLHRRRPLRCQVMDPMAIENFISVKEPRDQSGIGLGEHVKSYDVDIPDLQAQEK